jgi:hypothetical protein
MSDVVFILGAGASVDAGAPVMGDFLERAQRLLITRKVEDKREHFERVFLAISKLQVVHSKAQLDLNNIESIFTAFELAKIIGHLPGFDSPRKISALIESFKEVIVATLEQTTRFNYSAENRDITPQGSYSNLCALIKRLPQTEYIKDVSVITFNYDLALEFAMFCNSLTPNYMLKDESQPESGKLKSIKLLKLHGSLNWGIVSGKTEVVAFDVSTIKGQVIQHHSGRAKFQTLKVGKSNREVPLSADNGDIHIPIGSNLKEFMNAWIGIEIKPTPLIVPPTWNKSDYHTAIAPVWKSAAQELLNAQYIYIIGYSLPETDAFFKLLYGLGSVGETIIRKIVVYNPDDSGTVEARFRGMLGTDTLRKMTYKPMKFEEALSDISEQFFDTNIRNYVHLL